MSHMNYFLSYTNLPILEDKSDFNLVRKRIEKITKLEKFLINNNVSFQLESMYEFNFMDQILRNRFIF